MENNRTILVSHRSRSVIRLLQVLRHKLRLKKDVDKVSERKSTSLRSMPTMSLLIRARNLNYSGLHSGYLSSRSSQSWSILPLLLSKFKSLKVALLIRLLIPYFFLYQEFTPEPSLLQKKNMGRPLLLSMVKILGRK